MGQAVRSRPPMPPPMGKGNVDMERKPRSPRATEHRGASDAHASSEQPPHRAAGTFQLLHTSRDGKVCFFQDAEGHITAVNAARLV